MVWCGVASTHIPSCIPLSHTLTIIIVWGVVNGRNVVLIVVMFPFVSAQGRGEEERHY